MSGHEERERDDQGILDSVRRILAHDAAREGDRRGERADEVYELDSGMIVTEPEPPPTGATRVEAASTAPTRSAGTDPAPVRDAPPVGFGFGGGGPETAAPRVAGADILLGDDAGRSAGLSLASLRDAMRERAAVAVHRAGPTIEDVIREELRPLLRDWLDRHLPATVERLVRAEIERIAGRDT